MTRYVAVEGPPVQGIGLVAAGLIFEAAGAKTQREDGRGAVVKLFEKYRPQTLAEVKGQDKAVKEIRAVLSRGWGAVEEEET